MGISALIMSRAIFLDRDGVLNNAIVKNGKPYPPSTLNEVVIADDVLPSLQILKHMGYLLIGATNQPDVARGTADKALNPLVLGIYLCLWPCGRYQQVFFCFG